MAIVKGEVVNIINTRKGNTIVYLLTTNKNGTKDIVRVMLTNGVKPSLGEEVELSIRLDSTQLYFQES